jgi:hypothetical protein
MATNTRHEVTTEPPNEIRCGVRPGDRRIRIPRKRGRSRVSVGRVIRRLLDLRPASR